MPAQAPTGFHTAASDARGDAALAQETPHSRVVIVSRRLILDTGVLIAATAAATARIVITMDSSAAFDDLPGVRAQVVPR